MTLNNYLKNKECLFLENVGNTQCSDPFQVYLVLSSGLMKLLWIPFSEVSLQNHVLYGSLLADIASIGGFLVLGFQGLIESFIQRDILGALLAILLTSIVLAFILMVTAIQIGLIALSLITRTLATLYFIGEYVFSEDTSKNVESISKNKNNLYVEDESKSYSLTNIFRFR